jgi:hypothetical protein
MSAPSYQGILFPDRAESLAEAAYSGYRIFLDFWQPLSDTLKRYYEGLATRRDTRVLVVHAPQGGGKTMFARKLVSDFQNTRADGQLQPDDDNLWHRISGGGPSTTRAALIQQARQSTSIIVVTDEASFGGTVVLANKNWAAEVRKKIDGNDTRRWIVVIDNAERGHFLQSLVELSDAEFIDKRDSPALVTLAAQRVPVHGLRPRAERLASA